MIGFFIEGIMISVCWHKFVKTQITSEFKISLPAAYGSCG